MAARMAGHSLRSTWASATPPAGRRADYDPSYAPSYDAVRRLALCRIQRRPPRLSPDASPRL